MLYKNYSIWITKEKNPLEDDWEAFINEELYHFNYPHYFDSWGLCIYDISPKEVFKLAKMEIELYEMKLLKWKMDKSVSEIMKLDWRNNRDKQI